MICLDERDAFFSATGAVQANDVVAVLDLKPGIVILIGVLECRDHILSSLQDFIMENVVSAI